MAEMWMNCGKSPRGKLAGLPSTGSRPRPRRRCGGRLTAVQDDEQPGLRRLASGWARHEEPLTVNADVETADDAWRAKQSEDLPGFDRAREVDLHLDDAAAVVDEIEAVAFRTPSRLAAVAGRRLPLAVAARKSADLDGELTGFG